MGLSLAKALQLTNGHQWGTGECETYLEFYMFKDSIGVTELGVGQPCARSLEIYQTPPFTLCGNRRFLQAAVACLKRCRWGVLLAC